MCVCCSNSKIQVKACLFCLHCKDGIQLLGRKTSPINLIYEPCQYNSYVVIKYRTVEEMVLKFRCRHTHYGHYSDDKQLRINASLGEN